ncbi:MFS transporter [Massilia luteola]|uniref:MFS transporter n=1 Tax=Massilia luteola TaxID=3081751 RepID=UPI002ACBE78C|nr:MFS transporter [Massilia sp. Gc5]
MTTARWLFALQLVAMGAMEMSGPFWPLHLRRLGGLAPAGLAWASAAAYAGPLAMAMCTTPWWGRLGDRVGHKPMLLRALLALAATQWWIAATDSVAVILAVRLLQGALAGTIAAAQAYGARLVTREARGALMAQLQAATAIGAVAGPVLGGWLFDAWGFRTVNVWAGAACLLCAAVAAAALPPLPPTAPPPAAQPSAARPRPADLPDTMYGLLLGIVLVQAGKMMPQTFFGLYASEVLHVSSRVTGLCYAGTALGLCVAAPFWARRFARMAHARVLAQVEWILWACVAIVAVQAAASDVGLFLLARVLWGACLAALLPVFYGLLSRAAADDEQGCVLGAGNGAAKAGALLGAGAGGLALAWVPLSAMFWTVALLYAGAAVGMRAIRIRSSHFQHLHTPTGIS